jgi:Cu+-exporting ATPase
MEFKEYKIDESQKVACYHCGESCQSEIVHFDEKEFCCDGCKTVYDLLKENSMCTYYNLNENPGITLGKVINSGKYDYLDNENISSKLVRFSDENQVHITFFIPKIHCSSCIWLLENLHRLNPGIVSSNVNFLRKEATMIFDPKLVKLSEVATLMAHIGYEPLINLNDLEEKTEKKTNKNQVLKIGLAGFCFGNIMMLSFPEYFAFGNFHEQKNLSHFFGYLNLFLSLPVFFYSASEFFVSAWRSIRYRYLNIDAPIALAILVTFSRSIYEILSQTGAGYMDSMSGIVFFMLLGRYFQTRTYETLSFERDYKSYFPVGVTVKKENGKEVNIPVSELKKGDRILIRNNELIPSDSILMSIQSHIDYSFITGESAPVKKVAGELIYAGGKQLDGAVELEVINPTSQSYLTQLWNQDQAEATISAHQTFVDKINKYFTIVVLATSVISGVFWLMNDSSKALNALTAVLIVACPCGLLLTTTFANGNILRVLGRNKFYLKNAGVIDQLAKTDTVIFDKTGTITHGSTVEFVGPKLSEVELDMITSLAAQSSHPLSRKIYDQFSTNKKFHVSEFEELLGKGIRGIVAGKYVILGSEFLVTGNERAKDNLSTKVFLMIDGEVIGFFNFKNAYRPGLNQLVKSLRKDFDLKLISGDNDAEKENLETIFGEKSTLLFNQKPDEKMQFVQNLRDSNHQVMMIGDGLNDAGALRQSNIGIAVSDDTNNFSPACDAILDGSSFDKIPAFIQLAKSGKKVIIATFVISLIYNIVGLAFAVQGILSPVVAAILMPASSISIVLLTTVSTSVIARFKRL